MAKPVITFSWGFHNIRPMENGLVFAVRGYVHQGDVKVEYDSSSDSFSISTLKVDGSTKEFKDGIYLSELTDTIDKMVEYCENYRDKVMADYL